MEEIGSLARSSHLPPVEVVNDKSSFKELQLKIWVERLLSLTDTVITRLGCIEPEVILQNKCEEVVSLVILCGENNEVSEWNNPQVVHNAHKALILLAHVLGFEATTEIFTIENIVLQLFKELKTKVNKDDMKRFPASANCFTWAIQFLPVTQLDVLIPHILPVCLVLLDDWEIEYQTKGFDSIHYILKENPKSLETFGWYGVIYDNLKKRAQLSDNRYRVYECLDKCLQNLLPSRLLSREWNNKNHEYDSLVSNVIQFILVEDSPEALDSNLKILLMLVNSMQVKISCHLHPILTSIESKVMDDTPEEIVFVISSIIEGILQYCWPCFDERFCSLLAWVIYKLVNQPRGSNKSVLQTKKSFEIVLNRISPNLTAALCSGN